MESPIDNDWTSALDAWSQEIPKVEGYSGMVFALYRCVFIIYFDQEDQIYGASALLFDEELGWGFVDQEAANEIAYAHLHHLSNGELFQRKPHLQLVQTKQA